jgi:DNA-binding MarR family transcriptional regulator
MSQKPNRKEPPYVALPVPVLRDNTLSIGARALYAAVVRRMIRHKELVTVSYRLLARDLNIGERAIGRYMKELKDRGLFSVSRDPETECSVIRRAALSNTYPDENTKRYVKLPWVVLCDHNLELFERILYAEIVSYGIRNRNVAWPSESTMGNDLGFTRQTVSEHLKVLVQRGLISVRRRFQNSSIYTLQPVEDVYTRSQLAEKLSTLWEKEDTNDKRPNRAGY